MGRQQCVVWIFELNVAVNNIKILSVAEKYLYGKFILPITIKNTLVFVSSAQCFCLISVKCGVSWQILMKVPSKKFDRNKSSGCCTYTCGQSDMTKLIGAVCDYVHVHLKSTQHISLNSWSPDKIWTSSIWT